MMHRRMAIIAQRDIAELDLRGHAHLIASHTTAHRPALTASAAPSREMTGMRRIDQGAACAGCGEAGLWECACTWPWGWLWSWLWASGETIRECYIITLQVSTKRRGLLGSVSV